MSIENMFKCIDTYTANFCNVEEEKELIRFSDEKLPDMYDHNFILLKSHLDLAKIESIIHTEIQDRKNQGYNFCHVHLPLVSDKELANLMLPLKPEVSQYIIYTSDRPQDLLVPECETCVVRQVTTPEIAKDGIWVSNTLYSTDYAADFGQRSAARLAQVYLKSGGVDSYVCYCDNQPVGKADLLIHGDWAMIEDLVVIASKRCRGFGTSMLHTLINEALQHGANKVLLVADAEDTAKELYEKLGFLGRRGRTSLLFHI